MKTNIQQNRRNAQFFSMFHSQVLGYIVHSLPMDKEGQQLEDVGRKIYASSALCFKIASY